MQINGPILLLKIGEKFPKFFENFQKFLKIFKNFQKFSKIMIFRFFRKEEKLSYFEKLIATICIKNPRGDRYILNYIILN